MEQKTLVAPINFFIKCYEVHHHPLHSHFMGEKNKLIKYMSKSYKTSNQQMVEMRTLALIFGFVSYLQYSITVNISEKIYRLSN